MPGRWSGSMPGPFLRWCPVRSTLESVLRMTLAPGALAVIGYGLGAIAYAVLAVQVGVRRRRAGRAGVMLFAAVSSFLWQLSGVLVAVQPSDATSVLYLLLDALRVGAWCVAIQALPTLIIAESVSSREKIERDVQRYGAYRAC